MGQRAVAEALDGAPAAREPPAPELLGSDGATRRIGRQLLEVDDRVLAPRDGAEAALGQTPLERHLAALVARRAVAPRTGPPTLEAAAAQRLALPWTRADGAPAEPDLHHALAHDRSSATVLPRSAATAPGSFSWVSAAIVARTMLCGLLEPMHLVSTLLTPASSTTARTPPPAMTPVPADAGFSSTSPAPKRPVTV